MIVAPWAAATDVRVRSFLWALGRQEVPLRAQGGGGCHRARGGAPQPATLPPAPSCLLCRTDLQTYVNLRGGSLIVLTQVCRPVGWSVGLACCWCGPCSLRPIWLTQPSSPRTPLFSPPHTHTQSHTYAFTHARTHTHTHTHPRTHTLAAPDLEDRAAYSVGGLVQ